MTISAISKILNLSPDTIRKRAMRLEIYEPNKDYENDEIKMLMYYERKKRNKNQTILPDYTFRIVKAFDILRPNNTSVNIAEYTGINVVLVNRVLDHWFSGHDLIIKSRINTIF